MKVILASQSPRRRTLLAEIFEDFEVQVSFAEETSDRTQPSQMVVQIAKCKADAVARSNSKDCLIIAADTVVCLDGEILNKPKDDADAEQMLWRLSGEDHEVLTGVCLLWQGKELCFFDRSVVHFDTLTSRQIADYIKSGGPMDKAGGYGVQEVDFARVTEGSLSNVVGLPVEKLKEKLKEFGVNNGKF